MKLYSRNQVVAFCAGTAVIAFFLALGFGFLKLPFLVATETDTGKAGEVAAPGKTLIQGDSGMTPAGNGFQLMSGTNITDPIKNVDIKPDAGYTEDERINISVYETRNDAVVNVTTEVVAYYGFLEPYPQEGSSGSGSIIDKRGYVLTNYHVVQKAYKVYISLSDGTQYDGEVVGFDQENDLAIIRFDPKGHELSTIPFGSSEGLRVGQKVLAIGNPFAFERTLTTGIISALGRPIRNSEGWVIRDMIQTDASINPGNSGGPLLDSQGRMIGINTMIYSTSSSGGSVGIGFAIPVETAKRIVPELIQLGHVRRGWIDISPIQLFPQLVSLAKLPVKNGVLVSRVTAGGNAEKVGIRGGDRNQAAQYGRTIIYLGGDIIVEVDGDSVASLSDFFAALEDNKPGDTVSVVVIRNGQRKTFQVVLSERPDQNQW